MYKYTEMNAFIRISFDLINLDTGEVKTTEVNLKSNNVIDAQFVNNLHKKVLCYFDNASNLHLAHSTIQISLFTNPEVFFGHQNIFCSKIGLAHPISITLFINSLKKLK